MYNSPQKDLNHAERLYLDNDDDYDYIINLRPGGASEARRP